MVLTACGDADDNAADDDQGTNDNEVSADVNPDGSGDQAASSAEKGSTNKSTKDTEPPKTDVYGTWKCVAVDLEGDGTLMDAKEFKKTYEGNLGEMYVLEFAKNGKARLTTTIGDETGTGEFTYKESNGVYTLIENDIQDVDGYDQAVTAEIHGKTLTLVIAGRIASDDGQQVTVKLTWKFEKSSTKTSL